MVVLLMVKKNSMATLCTLKNTFKFVASFFLRSLKICNVGSEQEKIPHYFLKARGIIN